MMAGSPQNPSERYPHAAFGRRIRAHRKGLDLNQTDYGKRYDVGQITVSNWEKGVFRPGQAHLDRLKADGFDRIEGDGQDQRPYQLELPFDQTFLLELRIGPQRAGSVEIRVKLRELAN